MRKNKITKNYCCKLCGNLISIDSALYGKGMCKKCYCDILRIPANNYMYGRKHSQETKQKIALKHTKRKIICINCKKELKSRKAKRCTTCQSKRFAGKNCHLFKDGRSLIKKYCIDCDKKIYRGSKKCKSCANKENNNPNWQGGTSAHPYTHDFSKELKERIKSRDNFICQNCGLDMNSSLWQYGVNLQIHHIDYDKLKCNRTNLITLCCSCHCKSNYNRDYWYAYYTYIMENKIEGVNNGHFKRIYFTMRKSC